MPGRRGGAPTARVAAGYLEASARMVGERTTRRKALVLLSGAAVSLLAGCAALAQPPAAAPAFAPLAEPSPEPTRPAAPTSVPPTSVPPTPFLAPTTAPTAAPTPAAANPTSVPTPTQSPAPVSANATDRALAAAVDSAFAAAIEQRVTPGGVALVQHRGATILHAAYGHAAKYQAGGRQTSNPTPAEPDTIYDFASVSKLFTATCVMRLVEDGLVHLDDPIAKHLPAFAANGKEAITVRHLLTHTGGLPDWLKLWGGSATPAERLQRILAIGPTDPPGARYRYSDPGLITLGHLVEQVSGASLDQVVARDIALPLGLSTLQYRPDAALKPRIAPTEDQTSVGRGLVWGETHDENAWSLAGVAGHAGLFGTATDLVRFGQAYLAGSAPFLRPDTMASMLRNQSGLARLQGLGWELNASFYMGRLAAPVTFGHTGFTGTSLVVDPRHQLVVVLLTNRVHPSREGPSLNPLRQAVANAALAAAERA